MSTSFGGTPPGLPGTATHFGGWSTGLLGSDAPADGQFGAGPIRQRLSLPADANKRYRLAIESMPGTLTSWSYTEGDLLTATGPDGMHVGYGHLYEDGTDIGVVSISMHFGLGGYGTFSGGITLDGPGLSGGMLSVQPGTLGGGAVLGDGAAGGGFVGEVTAIARPPRSGSFTVAPRRVVRLTSIDPQEVPDLSPMAPGDTITLEFDFSPYAAVSAPDLAVARWGGDDGLAPVEKLGAPYVQDHLVLQRYTAPAGALGSTFRVTCTATVPDGNRLTATGRLPVRAD